MALGTAEPVAITARGGNTTIVQIKGEKNCLPCTELKPVQKHNKAKEKT